MNPGTLTSPVQGKLLERAIELRASGWQWDQIGAELSKGGKRITGPMVGAVVRRARKLDQPTPLVKETKPTAEVRAPVVHTTKSRAEGYLVVPDLQAPFHEPNALEFCERVRREFGIPKDNVLFT